MYFFIEYYIIIEIDYQTVAVYSNYFEAEKNFVIIDAKTHFFLLEE